MNKIFLCNLVDLKRDKFVKLWFDKLNDEVGAIYCKNQIFVYSTVCPHFGGEFELDENECFLKCKWHGWKFDINTGNSVTNFNMYKKNSIFNKILKLKSDIEIGCFPNKGKLKEYNHVIENNKIFIVYENR
tara:strand:+ start:227 stop:619 length:393 start_codon:yes stop_codon:yes gene_type:complete